MIQREYGKGAFPETPCRFEPCPICITPVAHMVERPALKAVTFSLSSLITANPIIGDVGSSPTRGFIIFSRGRIVWSIAGDLRSLPKRVRRFKSCPRLYLFYILLISEI